MRETEKIGPPWEIELTRDDGRIVEIKIKATGAEELSLDAVREATNAVLSKMRLEPGSDMARTIARSLFMLDQIYKHAGGKLTPEYLAQLAVTYSDVAATGSAVIPALARAIDGKPATVKGHVVKAREEGYLTKTTPGKEGGDATDKAREVLLNFATT
jgi:hypothetical protein